VEAQAGSTIVPAAFQDAQDAELETPNRQKASHLVEWRETPMNCSYQRAVKAENLRSQSGVGHDRGKARVRE
jgi:hypothetical protein